MHVRSLAMTCTKKTEYRTNRQIRLAIIPFPTNVSFPLKWNSPNAINMRLSWTQFALQFCASLDSDSKPKIAALPLFAANHGTQFSQVFYLCPPPYLPFAASIDKYCHTCLSELCLHILYLFHMQTFGYVGNAGEGNKIYEIIIYSYIHIHIRLASNEKTR